MMFMSSCTLPDSGYFLGTTTAKPAIGGPPPRARRHLLRQLRHLTLAPVRASLSACGRPIIGPPPEWIDVFISRSSTHAGTETLAALANRNPRGIRARSSRPSIPPSIPLDCKSNDSERLNDELTTVLHLSRHASISSRLLNPASPSERQLAPRSRTRSSPSSRSSFSRRP